MCVAQSNKFYFKSITFYFTIKKENIIFDITTYILFFLIVKLYTLVLA